MSLKDWMIYLATMLSATIAVLLINFFLGSVQGGIATVGAWTIGAMILWRAKERKNRQKKIQEWRDSHPGMPDIWLPEKLK